MFIVSAVNVYPSDIEYVIRGLPEVTGEYKIRIFEQDFTCKYEVTVENALGGDCKSDEAVARRVSDALKARTGVKPASVIVLPDGAMERSTHKAARIIDERRTGSAI
jgi:phenylacetate-CoA ligase